MGQEFIIPLARYNTTVTLENGKKMDYGKQTRLLDFGQLFYNKPAELGSQLKAWSMDKSSYKNEIAFFGALDEVANKLDPSLRNDFIKNFLDIRGNIVEDKDGNKTLEEKGNDRFDENDGKFIAGLDEDTSGISGADMEAAMQIAAVKTKISLDPAAVSSGVNKHFHHTGGWFENAMNSLKGLLNN